MKYEDVIKEARLELSDAKAADKEDMPSRAKQCLLNVKEIIEKALEKD